ncbi:MAG: hypothetical protein PUP90_30780 [Nostoc sp. S4]|nr:hypothetical protein [Nostoc sp. S4]
MSKIESPIDKSKRSLLQQKPPKFHRWLRIFAVALAVPGYVPRILAEPL